MHYPDTPDSRYLAQLVNDFFFPWEEEGSAENLITIVEDQCFSELLTPPAPLQSRLALRSIENLQNSLQLFD